MHATLPAPPSAAVTTLSAALLATLTAPAAATGALACRVEMRCDARGCEDPGPDLAFALRIDAEGARLRHGAGAEMHLPALAAPAPHGLRLFGTPDGNGQAFLSLRDDGVLTLSLHAGRRAGPPTNDSTLAMGRCEGHE